MLDLGFIQPIRRIVAKLSHKRQNLFFSATMPSEIGKLAERAAARSRSASPSRRRPPRSSASLSASSTSRRARSARCWSSCSPIRELSRALVFTRTKRGADRVADHLEAAGITRRRHPRQQEPEPARAGAGGVPQRRRSACWSPPTSPRAASTSIWSATSSTSSCRTCRRATCTASAARRAPAPRAAPSRSCDAEERDQLRDIERLTRQSIPAEDRRQDTGLTADRGGRAPRGRPGQDRGGRRNGSGEPSRQRSGANGRNASRDGARDRSGERSGWRARDTDRNGAAGERREGSVGDRPSPAAQRRDTREAANDARHSGYVSRDRRETRGGARPTATVPRTMATAASAIPNSAGRIAASARSRPQRQRSPRSPAVSDRNRRRGPRRTFAELQSGWRHGRRRIHVQALGQPDATRAAIKACAARVATRVRPAGADEAPDGSAAPRRFFSPGRSSNSHWEARRFDTLPVGLGFFATARFAVASALCAHVSISSGSSNNRSGARQ